MTSDSILWEQILNDEGDGKMDFTELQNRQKAWADYNFGVGKDSTNTLLGVMEEVGELSHAHLKQHQGIRGNAAELEEKAKDAWADIIIFLMDYANRRGWDGNEIITSVWSAVEQRDWKKYPKNGRTE